MFKVLAAVLLLHAAAVFAAVPATVEAVQSPAWLERQGWSQPLSPGQELHDGDIVRTGAGARAWLLLAEGSRVKLGEATRFTLHSSSLEPARYFRGALDIAAGAFRFTTGLLSKDKRREVAIRIGTATIGIRGTDLWGKTDRDGDLVLLLEGRIGIEHGGAVTELTQPWTYLDAPHGQAATVKLLDPERFRAMARQTEIIAGDGASRIKGKHGLPVVVANSSEEALETYDRLREAGFAARIQPRAVEGGWQYELKLTGFTSPDEAQVAARRARALLAGGV
jgi:hypothetical protein